MATQDCPGVLQVEMRYIADGQVIENVYHVSNDTGTLWSQVDIEAVLDEFKTTLWTGAQRAMVCSATALVEIVGTDLTSLLGKKVIRAISPVEAGTNASTNLPNNSTIAIKLNTPERGRGKSGRVFWPTLPRSAVTLDEVDPAYIAAAILGIADLMTALGALTGNPQLVVLSRVLNGVKRAVGIGQAITTLGISDTSVDSMKLRLPRHKRHKRRAGPI